MTHEPTAEEIEADLVDSAHAFDSFDEWQEHQVEWIQELCPEYRADLYTKDRALIARIRAEERAKARLQDDLRADYGLRIGDRVTVNENCEYHGDFRGKFFVKAIAYEASGEVDCTIVDVGGRTLRDALSDGGTDGLRPHELTRVRPQGDTHD